MWCCHELWQTWLGSGVVVAVAQAGSCNSDQTSSLGTSICHSMALKKAKKNKQKNPKTKLHFTCVSCMCAYTNAYFLETVCSFCQILRRISDPQIKKKKKITTLADINKEWNEISCQHIPSGSFLHPRQSPKTFRISKKVLLLSELH